MSRKTLRIFICAAAAAALGMFGTMAQATFYGGDFDPPTILGHFTGSFLLDVTGACDHPNGEGSDCRIDLIDAVIDTSSTFGPGWVAGPHDDIATHIIFDGHLIAFDSILVDLFIPPPPVEGGLSQFTAAVIPCNPSLTFTSAFPPDGDFLGHKGPIADLECNNTSNQSVGDNAIYVLRQIPEPGTLALILGGVGAAWFTRRRKGAF